MSSKQKAAQGSAATASGKKFKDMNQSEKMAFIGKAFIFFLSCGFAYPNIFMD